MAVEFWFKIGITLVALAIPVAYVLLSLGVFQACCLTSKQKEKHEGTETDGKEFVPAANANKQKLDPERQEDLEFYKIFLSRRMSFKSLEKLLKGSGRFHQAEFIKELNNQRFQYSVTTRSLLRRYFAREESEAEGVADSRLSAMEDEWEVKETIGEMLRTFSPPTIFDAAEQSIILALGDAIFPNYREHIDGLATGVKAAMKSASIHNVYTELTNKLRENDPYALSAMHCHPPHCHIWAKAGDLQLVTKGARKKRTFTLARFGIDLFYPKEIKGELKEKLIPRFVFSSSTDNDPIELSDAKVERDPADDFGFHLSGKSAARGRRMIKLHLIARTREDREKWVTSIKKFHDSKENAKKNIALVINFFCKFSEALQERDYKKLELFVEQVAHHMLVAGFGSVRATIPISVRSVLYRAAGDLCWNDEAFRICSGWLKLLLEACMEDIKEFKNLYGQEEAKDLIHRSHTCSIQ